MKPRDESAARLRESLAVAGFSLGVVLWALVHRAERALARRLVVSLQGCQTAPDDAGAEALLH